MDWIQLENYMLIVEKDKTAHEYKQLSMDKSDDYTLFIEHCLDDMHFVEFLKQFGIDQTKPVSLQATMVEQGEAILFTGKFYFEGYLEMGEYDLWDIVIGDAVLSFTKEEPAPFSTNNASFVEISFEIVKPSRVKL